MKYEWCLKKDIPNIFVVIILFLLLLSICIGSISSCTYKTRYTRAESELGQLRDLLESANSRESELEEQLGTIKELTGEAVDYVSREQDLLIKSGNTIREIRAQVEDLERYCDCLEFWLYSIRDNIDTNKIEKEIEK